MRKIVFMLLLAGVLMAGCNEESVFFASSDIEVDTRQGPEKVYICHFDKDNMDWVLLHLPPKSIQAHLNHGDILLNDADEDGYYPDNGCNFEPMGDCADDDPYIYPGAVDDCLDGIDSDCNGEELPCRLACKDELNCCFCDIVENITWMADAFYCAYDYGYALQYYLCPDGECAQWIEAVIYPNYPAYNYCSYSLGEGQVKNAFDNPVQAQSCVDFIVDSADKLSLPPYCIPVAARRIGIGVPVPPDYNAIQ